MALLPEQEMEPTMEPTMEETPETPMEDGKEQTDLWRNEDVQSYFDGAKKGKIKIEEEYYQFHSKALNMLSKPEVIKGIVEMLAGPNPVDATVNTAVAIMNNIDRAMQKVGETMSDEVKLFVANELIGYIGAIGEKANVAYLDSDEKEVAFAEACREYLAQNIAAGRIDKDKLAELNGESIRRMTPEQRRDIDRQLKELDRKAAKVADKYGDGLPQAPPLGAQQAPQQQAQQAPPPQQAQGGAVLGNQGGMV